MATAGEHLRQFMQQLVIGQSELARAAGLTQGDVWMIVNNKRNPRPATIRKLAAALTELSGKMIEPAELLGDKDGGEP